MKYLLMAMTLLLATAEGYAREVMNLNRNWQFSMDNDLNLRNRQNVHLPHTWNYDAVSARQDYVRGLANYFKDVRIPDSWRDKRVYLRFKGVNSEANVFVNGRFAGEHTGGYTGFTIEITPFLRFGSNNNLWVRVNNAPQLDYMPVNGDFNIYGGIYRDVELIVTEPNHIALSDYGSDGVYLKQGKVTDKKAEVDALVSVDAAVPGTYTVTLDVNDSESGFTILSRQEKVKTDEGRGAVTLPFSLENPRLWNGLREAYRYEVVVKLQDDKKTLDSLVVPMGLRYFAIDPDSGFMLNGRKYPLHGVTRHQDRSGRGNALRPEEQEEDLDLMLEMGVNAVRMINYPQDPYFYELADRYGLILWSELPLVGPRLILDNGYINKESFRENGRQQLREMILQHYNNPSVFFWGLFSNLITRGDDPSEYIRELNTLAHELDPTRPTIGTSNQDGDINFITDLIGWSQYLGWQSGQVSDVDVWLKQLTRDWKQLKSAIGEYGAGGALLHQSDSLTRPGPRDTWHPERWQTHYHERFYDILKKYPAIWGSFVHSMFDYGSPNFRGGDTPGVSDFGLVTYDRQKKKDAFYFYKANWNRAEPFVHIAEKRWNERADRVQTLKVFSNQPEVELVVNGISQGQKTGTNGVFVWERVELQPGENTVEAYSGRVNDGVEIRIVPSRTRL